MECKSRVFSRGNQVSIHYFSRDGLTYCPHPPIHGFDSRDLEHQWDQHKSHPLINFTNLSHIYYLQFREKQQSFTVNSSQMVNNWTSLQEFQHYKVLKIKLPKYEINLKSELQKFLQHYPGKVRLDPHHPLSLSELHQWVHNLPLDKIDYLESPLAEITDYLKLDIPVSIALDQEAPHFINKQWDIPYSPDVLIIRPSLLHFSSIEDLIQLLTTNAANMRWIVSSHFDAGTSFFFHCYLAHRLAPFEYHGLSTYRFLNPQLFPGLNFCEQGSLCYRS